MNFNEYYWHDSIIKSISIDRSKPGIVDEILFDIEWSKGGRCILKFKDVYWASMNLNFGIVADENILNATILNRDDKDLIKFYSSWNGLMDEIVLTAFLIELNSSGSTIKIIAKGYEIITS